MKKKLSIIIAAYNIDKYISDCLNSCLAQNFKDFEIICVDDGATDYTPAILDKYSLEYPDIVKVIHKKNGGVSSARNMGIMVAEGEWLWFIDGDDFISENCIGVMLSVLKDNDEMLFFDSDKPHEYSKVVFNEKLKIKKLDESNFFDSRPSKGTGGGAWSYWIKREVVVRHSILFDTAMKYCEDVKFMFQYRICCKKNGVLIDNAVYHYRQNDCSAMHNVDGVNYLYSMEKMFQLYYDFYIKADTDYMKMILLNKIVDALQAIQYCLLFKTKDYKLAKEKIGYYKSLGVYPIKSSLTNINKNRNHQVKRLKEKIYDFLLIKLFNKERIYLLMCKLHSDKGKKR